MEQWEFFFLFFPLAVFEEAVREKNNIVKWYESGLKEKEREFFLSMVMGERREREKEQESVSCLLILCMLVDFFLFHAWDRRTDEQTDGWMDGWDGMELGGCKHYAYFFFLLMSRHRVCSVLWLWFDFFCVPLFSFFLFIRVDPLSLFFFELKKKREKEAFGKMQANWRMVDVVDNQQREKKCTQTAFKNQASKHKG